MQPLMNLYQSKNTVMASVPIKNQLNQIYKYNIANLGGSNCSCIHKCYFNKTSYNLNFTPLS